jgi:hypothetical protein
VRRLAFVVVLMVTVLPAQAHADTFYVDDSAPFPMSPCTNPNPANACTSIQVAINQARGMSFPGGDTILVAAGNYPQAITMGSAADAGNVIDGAGTHSGTGGSTINPAAPAGPVVTVFDSVPDVIIRDFRVEVLPASNHAGMEISGPNSELSNIAVNMQQAANNSSGININTGPSTLERVTVGGAWSGIGIGTSQPPAGTSLTIRDSTVRNNGATAAIGTTQGWQVQLQRSRIQSSTSNTGATLSLLDSSAYVDSSLILGGGASIGTSAFGSGRQILVLNSTLDAETLGVNDSQAVLLNSGGDSALIDSSIALGSQVVTSGANIVCTNSDLPLQQEPGISCGAGGSNSTSSPASLFMNAAGGDFHLLATSPAIDKGSAATLGSRESTTDRDGNPRVLDGNRDCVARRDRGAHEKTGQSAACPPGPTPTTPTTPVDLAPAISKLTMTHRRFRVKRRRRTARRSRRAPVGTRFRYTLSEDARVTFRFQRRARGRRVAGRCRKPTRRNRGRRRCLRWVRVKGSFAQNGHAGRNGKRWSGRLRGKALRAGRYRAVLRAKDSSGKPSKRVRITFRVVRR